MKKQLLLCILLVSVFSCESKKKKATTTLDDCPVIAQRVDHKGNDLIVCDLSLVKDTFDVPITPFLSTFEVVRLENTDDALIDTQGHIRVSENYIGVYSYSPNSYKLFNREGKLLKIVATPGQGPDEYIIGLIDSFIDEEEQKVYLLSYMTNKILVFDFDGNPLTHIPLAYPTHKGNFRIHPGEERLTMMVLPFADSPSVVWEQDFDGNVLQEIGSGHFVIDPGDYSNEIEWSGTKQNSAFSLFHWMPENDSLYRYDREKNCLYPQFTVTFKNEIERHGYTELPSLYWVRLLVPSYGSFTPRSPQFIVDKQTLKGCYINWKINPLGNIDGPSWLQFNRGYYIANMYPHELKEQLAQVLKTPEKLTSEVRARVKKLHDSLTEDDNNIIIYGKLRNYE